MLYEALVVKIRAEYFASSIIAIIEEILIRDIAYHICSAMLLRRVKGHLSVAGMTDILRETLQKIDPQLTLVKLAERWAVRQPQAIAQVDTLLSEAGLTIASVEAEAFVGRLGEIDCIDRLMTSAEARRHGSDREFHRRRAEAQDQFARESLDYHAANNPRRDER